MSSFSTITVLINPAAGSGTGEQLLALVKQSIPLSFPNAKIDFIQTKSKEHVLEIAATCNAELVICVGGDGTVHDFAQPLMQRPPAQRPCVAVVPVGSGNDYARTLGVSLDPAAALSQLAHGQVVAVDVGKVNDNYFLETLSFGVDAAVAINTEQLRRTTHTKGLRLYARAAVSAIIRELKVHKAHYVLDGVSHTNSILIMAVQNGPTYGSGFKVAPRASVTDGRLDVYTAANIGTIKALYYLSQMKNGKHEKLKGFANYKAGKIQLELEEQVPTQCDGEQIFGTSFKIEVIPAALKVYVPGSSPILAK